MRMAPPTLTPGSIETHTVMGHNLAAKARHSKRRPAARQAPSLCGGRLGGEVLPCSAPMAANPAKTRLKAPDLFGYRKYWAQRLTPALFLPMSREEMDE